eukprot:10523847-Lingulodinium_polyedra.AAC.1
MAEKLWHGRPPIAQSGASPWHKTRALTSNSQNATHTNQGMIEVLRPMVPESESPRERLPIANGD